MVATLEKFLDMCPIDDQQLQRFYSTLPDDCKSYFSNKYINELRQYGHEVLACRDQKSVEAKLGVRGRGKVVY